MDILQDKKEYMEKCEKEKKIYDVQPTNCLDIHEFLDAMDHKLCLALNSINNRLLKVETRIENIEKHPKWV